MKTQNKHLLLLTLICFALLIGSCRKHDTPATTIPKTTADSIKAISDYIDSASGRYACVYNYHYGSGVYGSRDTTFSYSDTVTVAHGPHSNEMIVNGELFKYRTDTAISFFLNGSATESDPASYVAFQYNFHVISYTRRFVDDESVPYHYNYSYNGPRIQ